MADDDIDLVARLFAREVPEIAAGRIEIKAIAHARLPQQAGRTEPRSACRLHWLLRRHSWRPH